MEGMLSEHVSTTDEQTVIELVHQVDHCARFIKVCHVDCELSSDVRAYAATYLTGPGEIARLVVLLHDGEVVTTWSSLLRHPG